MSDSNDKNNPVWSVEVLGRGVLGRTLLSTKDAYKVVVRDENGAPAMAMVRVNDGTWGFSAVTDDDWAGVCAKYGIQ